MNSKQIEREAIRLYAIFQWLPNTRAAERSFARLINIVKEDYFKLARHVLRRIHMTRKHAELRGFKAGYKEAIETVSTKKGKR